MTILAIDTTTRWGSVAVVAGGCVQASLAVSAPLDHSESLLPTVSHLLSRLDLGVGDLQAVAAARGPGSFTGVRIGLASAQGLALAAGVRGLGLSSLEALALSDAGAPEGAWLCPWIDAGRGEVYAAAYLAGSRGLISVREPCLVRPDRWLEGLPAVRVRFLGDGAMRHRDLLASALGPTCLAGPGPWFLAEAVGRWAEGHPLEPASPLEPLYVRPPDAERGGAAGG